MSSSVLPDEFLIVFVELQIGAPICDRKPRSAARPAAAQRTGPAAVPDPGARPTLFHLLRVDPVVVAHFCSIAHVRRARMGKKGDKYLNLRRLGT